MINIAIDGPSGAGKSTISKLAAERFGYIYVDTLSLIHICGTIVVSGTPEQVAKCKKSYTGQYLKNLLKQ